MLPVIKEERQYQLSDGRIQYNMKVNISPYVSIAPRIVLCSTNCTIVIKAKYQFVSLLGNYSVAIFPKYQYSYDSIKEGAYYEPFVVAADNGVIKFNYDFEQEQEYIIQVKPAVEQGRTIQVIESSVYALKEDLYKKKVLKGDLHLHTTFSDGIESPEHRAVMARENGFDFLAITDHNSYHGSKYLIEKMKACPNNMVFIRGEEVHAKSCPVHILSLGASNAIAPSVTRMDLSQIRHLECLKEKYASRLDKSVNCDAFVAAMDVFEKIRISGGLSVLCHIYWDAVDGTNHRRMGAPEQLIDALVKECAFDAFEITSGAPENDLKANYLQEAYYREKLPVNFPVIGITDTHSTLNGISIFGKNYTIVFADECSEFGIIEAIRNKYSVSVDGVGNTICHGEIRLIKYATFLIEHYFPTHDQIVRIEGEIMQRILEGNHNYLEILRNLIDDNKIAIMHEWRIYA